MKQTVYQSRGKMRLKWKNASLSSLYIGNCCLHFFLLFKQFSWRKEKGMKKEQEKTSYTQSCQVLSIHP